MAFQLRPEVSSKWVSAADVSTVGRPPLVPTDTVDHGKCWAQAHRQALRWDQSQRCTCSPALEGLRPHLSLPALTPKPPEPPSDLTPGCTKGTYQK